MLALNRGQAAAGLLACLRRGAGIAVPVHAVLDAQAGTLRCVALKLRVNLAAVTAIPGAQHGMADALVIRRLPVEFALVFAYVNSIIHVFHFLCVSYAAVTAQLDRTAGRAKIVVQPVQRVGALAFPAHFKMQVCAVTVAGIAAVADQLAFPHLLPLSHAELAQVGIQGFEGAILVGRVAQLDHVAIAVDVPLGALAVPAVGRLHCAALCGVYRRAHRRAEIQRPVQAAVIVEPACGDNVLGQGPMQQGFFILQPHFYPPYFVLFHI